MGLFALVLHTHLPYVRRNGVWPCGEDFFHQAASESYLPVLGALRRIADMGLRDALTVGVSPLVAHQMEDAHMLREVAAYLGRFEPRAMRQVVNYHGSFQSEIRDLAAHYALQARRQLSLLDSLPGGIATGYDDLERAGVIEILGGPASHPYMPLVTQGALAGLQVEHGLAEHERIFGRRPRGVWLPECAYTPGGDPPIEARLEAAGVTHFVVDGPTMLRSAGPGTTFAPRAVGDSSVAAFARDLDVTYRVWSPTGGYPADGWYRDFFHYDLEAGFKNWRVTNRTYALDRKRPYEPERGAARARDHAEEFVALLDRRLAEHERETGSEGVVVACYDTELFGHWWYEGPEWLERVYELLSEHSGIRPVTLSAALEAMPAPAPVALAEGSWGFRKDDRSWVAPETEEMWGHLGEVETLTVRIASEHAHRSREAPGRWAALSQILRECLLLQNSDWPFMVLRGRNPGYARERFFSHLLRWRQLVSSVESAAPDLSAAALAADVYEVDNVFPSLDCTALQPALRSPVTRGPARNRAARDSAGSR